MSTLASWIIKSIVRLNIEINLRIRRINTIFRVAFWHLLRRIRLLVWVTDNNSRIRWSRSNPWILVVQTTSIRIKFFTRKIHSQINQDCFHQTTLLTQAARLRPNTIKTFSSNPFYPQDRQAVHFLLCNPSPISHISWPLSWTTMVTFSSVSHPCVQTVSTTPRKKP